MYRNERAESGDWPRIVGELSWYDQKEEIEVSGKVLNFQKKKKNQNNQHN
jgi:hypothetical protein